MEYPQRIRGGAGFFPEEGKVILEGYYGAQIELTEGGSVTPPPSNGNGLIMRQGALAFEWKRGGSTDHPDIGAQFVVNPTYFQVGMEGVGFWTTLDFMIEIADPSKLGSGPNGKGWYFIPIQSFLKPDFDNGSSESVGTWQMWVNDGHIDLVGGSKWSRNVGSGIDGILLNLNGGNQPLAENYPRTWPIGSKLRVQIQYWVPA